ncbi:uncharacterized protein LOC121896033 [Thunnus maccoyii]|uniref:uncharacterized protein LOC121896033 n=1 Tax=Thunnus maccoyii TaxID=8240 RepID=UPI001C4A9CEE|nr:uncharacterized protein LOC121896033 [Thunnus maccoyii]
MIFCIRIKLRMNIHHVLFFCFLSALQDGNTGLVNAINLFAGAEGGSGSIICHLTSSGSTKLFCKGECKEEDILIETDGVTAQSGRHSIRYEDGSSGRRSVTVTITQLTKSDSGRYRCGLEGSSVPDSYTDFDVTVTDERLHCRPQQAAALLRRIYAALTKNATVAQIGRFLIINRARLQSSTEHPTAGESLTACQRISLCKPELPPAAMLTSHTGSRLILFIEDHENLPSV